MARINVHKKVNPADFISISLSNDKMGLICSFSTPCITTCPINVPCIGVCYADCMEHRRKVVHESYLNNLDMMLKYPKDVENAIVDYIDNELYTLRYFRFNVAGDVEVGDATYIHLIMNVVKRCPNTKFLVYTKSKMWNRYKKLPKNLSLVYSYWEDWSFSNPYNRPTSNVMPEPDEEHMEEATKGKLICRNCLNKEIKCDSCHICWNLKPGQNVWFFAHGTHKNRVKGNSKNK